MASGVGGAPLGGPGAGATGGWAARAAASASAAVTDGPSGGRRWIVARRPGEEGAGRAGYGVMFCHRFAGTNWDRWATLAVTTTTCGAPKVIAWAAKITS